MDLKPDTEPGTTPSLTALARANPDRTAALALGLLGVVALLLGWLGTSGTGLAAEQTPYLVSGGMLGLALVAAGATLWLSADLQDDWRKLDGLEDALTRLAEAVEADGREALDPLVAPPLQRRARTARPRPGAPAGRE